MMSGSRGDTEAKAAGAGEGSGLNRGAVSGKRTHPFDGE